MTNSPTTLELLGDLISFPTVSRDSNRALIDYCAQRLEDHGAEVTLITAENGTKANLYATIGPLDTPGVMLSGHTDVVPVDGQNWTKPPFEAVIEGDRIYGRGSTDMKGFVAASLACCAVAGERELKTPLHFSFSYDEEIGCMGVRSLIKMLDEVPMRPAMCIVGEPTSMAIATGHKGKMAIDATCIGSEGHSAFAPWAVNAIHLACDLIAEIRILQKDFEKNGNRDEAYDIPYTTLHAGVINSGIALNIVPGHAAVKFEIRNLVVDDPEVILERLRCAISPIISAAKNRSPEANIIFEVINAYPGLETPLDEDVVEMVAGLTVGNDRIKVAFGTEGGLFSEMLSVPTVVCGPGSIAQAHKPDEFITLDQLTACDVMLLSLIDRLEKG